MNDEILIYTKNGMVPASTLDYSTSWQNNIESTVTLTINGDNLIPVVKHGGSMVFVETYHDKETKELVKQSVHVCQLAGFDITSEQGNLNT